MAALYTRNLFQRLFLFILGISIGVVSTLCFQSFYFTFSSLPFFIQQPPSIAQQSTPPPPPQPQSPLPPPPPPPPAVQQNPELNETSLDVSLKNDEMLGVVMHNMSDDELLLRASSVSAAEGENATFKVAFMFLTPGALPLAPLWDRYFKGHQGLYSIYVHPHPSYNDSTPPDSAFYGTRIPSQEVQWGTMSMIDAERRLLANALLDSSNKRFVLLSDSCIPVFNFTFTYNHLIGADHSFLSSFDDPRKVGRGRYNPRMWPNITIEQWRKGSQWFELHRDLAVAVVSDHKYYPVFREFCLPPCYNDEHYIPTLVNILYADMNSNRTVTWVDWSRGGPHPRKFGWVDINVETLNHIRFGYECSYNGNTTNLCHLFGRKFLPNTLGPLLRVAPPLLGFDP